LVYNVLFYEPNGAQERIHPVRAAYDALKDKSRTIVTLVDACREEGLLPPGFPLAKSVQQIVEYGSDAPLLKEQLPKIPPEERLCLNLGPYQEPGRIPETFDDLQRAYRALVRDAETVEMFAFSAYQGDGELEKIMQGIATSFPLLEDCFWLACASEAEPLSETVKKQMEAGLGSGSRSVLFYNRETAVLAARKAAEKILACPQLHKRTPRTRIETGLWNVSPDGVIQPAHEGPKNFDYYVSKYAKMLQERAIKPEGLTHDDFDLVLAAFKVEGQFPDDDQTYARVSRALQREFNYLLKIVTRL
jgi:hypothetical protein